MVNFIFEDTSLTCISQIHHFHINAIQFKQAIDFDNRNIINYYFQIVFSFFN